MARWLRWYKRKLFVFTKIKRKNVLLQFLYFCFVLWHFTTYNYVLSQKVVISTGKWDTYTFLTKLFALLPELINFIPSFLKESLWQDSLPVSTKKRLVWFPFVVFKEISRKESKRSFFPRIPNILVPFETTWYDPYHCKLFSVLTSCPFTLFVVYFLPTPTIPPHYPIKPPDKNGGGSNSHFIIISTCTFCNSPMDPSIKTGVGKWRRVYTAHSSKLSLQSLPHHIFLKRHFSPKL